MLNKSNKNMEQFKVKNEKLTLSIAMCTFNGAVYLSEQLDSISKQTHLPDELIVCDDNSTDMTQQILNEFRELAPFQVKIFHNIKKLGSTKNFEKAITLCRGDIIILSDQDDVWLPNKIEKLENIFKNNHNIGYVFSDAIIVDEKLSPLGYTMWKSILFTKYQRRLFKDGYQLEVLLKHNVVTGATMAFRANIRVWILPISGQWVHDAWIALLSSALGINGDFYEEPLSKYRQHHQQSIGGRKLNLHEQFQNTYKTKSEFYKIIANKFECIIERLNHLHKLTKKNKKLFQAKIEHLKTRERIHGYKKWKCYHLIFRELLNGRYHRFSNDWKNVIKDLFL